ncbi:ubiquitin carboxyl-terminal hydrolase MINDY-2-like [Ipomoea triloba]|uniref:ubiquitin carboxyl-terminal hydrolase MINDY-2-like n=1 Tax=Ipomoea triloba TaxID=35885 RepID=UPI00125CD9B5|nr:ubiquitin carboxyl-terminal hydrolase MINDY-2-like [Ipomoea triloba]
MFPYSSSDDSSSPDEPGKKEMRYKTKVIQFMGRTTPIVLQNDNGPCPLLAICNILLLTNRLELSPDVPEVSQQKLLSLVAKRLIYSSSNVNDKDAEYVKNQQQKVTDAIDLLPRLATGLFVNTKFERIGDFEYTGELAIFELLDIPLYHGWIVDPEDHDTAKAIGSKTYNTLMGELVALETRDMGSEHKKSAENDAATTAALGVPSPTLSRGKSFNDSSVSISDKHKARRGDIEEEEQLQRALELSMAEGTISSGDDLLTNVQNSPNVVANIKDHERLVSDKASEINVAKDTSQPEAPISNVVTVSDGSRKLDDVVLNPNSCESESAGVAASSSPRISHDPSKETGEPNLLVENTDQSEEVPSSAGGSHVRIVGDNIDSHLSSGRRQDSDDPETFTSSVDGRQDSDVLAKQVDGDSRHVHNESPEDGISAREGELIRNFLNANASQLTIYGLGCLQAGLKERELCVFFRNNHFNTMFKFEGELYILATDIGFLNQPNLVWEKLNEVKGDTYYVTSNFKEFKLGNSSNNAWDRLTAITSTAEFLESLGNAVKNKYFDPDTELAISLQQQEFEQEGCQARANRKQAQPIGDGGPRLIVGPRNQAQPTGDGGPRLIVGPRNQVSRPNRNQSTSSSNQESEPAKEKCTVM